MEGITSPPVEQSNNGVFNPLLISILGIVVTITAIGLYHFILVKYCMRRIAAAATTTSPQTAATGVDKKILQNIPILTITYLERRRFHSNQEECVVCLGELEDGDVVRILPNCSHAFHVPCIDAWFSTHVTCPLCRSLITAENPNTTPCRSTDSSDLEISNIGTSNSSGDTETQPRVQSSGLLRHCVSLALPPAGERRQTPAKLKRSLSMDQSFVLINLQIDNRTSNSSSSRGELTTSDPHITRSLNHFDRVSSKLRRSFSRLRLGKGSDHAPILPY